MDVGHACAVSSGAYLGRSSGSGVVISEQGDVVTNAHVVNSASNRLGGPQKIVVSMQVGHARRQPAPAPPPNI